LALSSPGKKAKRRRNFFIFILPTESKADIFGMK